MSCIFGLDIQSQYRIQEERAAAGIRFSAGLAYIGLVATSKGVVSNGKSIPSGFGRNKMCIFRVPRFNLSFQHTFKNEDRKGSLGPHTYVRRATFLR